MRSFDTILKKAVKRCGGEAALNARLPEVKSTAALKAEPDGRYLSLM